MTAGPLPGGPEYTFASRSHRDSPSLLSPARARYLLLVIVMLLGGAYVGQYVGNQAWGESWMATMSECLSGDIRGEAGTGARPDSATIQQQSSEIQRNYQRQLRCTAFVERRRALSSLAGALSVLALGVVLMLLLPYRLTRRAGPFQPLPASWAARVESAAQDMGLRRVPEVSFGSLRMHEPFTAGRPGRPRVILPPGILALPREQADAIIRHELAHVRAGDVTLVWLTRGVWWALSPVLLIPPAIIFGPFLKLFVVALFTEAGSVPAKLEFIAGFVMAMLRNPLTVDYGSRTVLLLALAATVSLAVLRSREHEADIAADRRSSADALAKLLRVQPAPRRSWWRRLTAIHPTPARRLAALSDQSLALHSPAIEAFMIALLATVVLRDLASYLPYGFADSFGGPVRVAGLVAGVVLALGWGVAQWRSVAAAQIGGRVTRTRWVTPAICGGVLAGQIVSIRNTATTTLPVFWTSNLLMFAIVPLAVAGAGACSIAFARKWNQVRRTDRLTRGDYLTAAAVNVILFTNGFWAGLDLATHVSIGSGQIGAAPHWVNWIKAYLISGTLSNRETYAAASFALIALLAWWWTRRTGAIATHSSQVGHDTSGFRSNASYALSVLFISGAAAAGASIVRWFLTSPVERGFPVHTLQFDRLVSVCAGLACLLVLAALEGKAGLVSGVAASVVATSLTATIGWLHFVGEYSSPFDALRSQVEPALGMIVVVVLTIGIPMTLLRSRAPSHRPVVRRAAVAAAMVTSALLGIMVVNTGDLFLVYL
ncbi:M56 family metallopeptidase [Sphaerisporangium sp. B11E5]|uniref:M56 family metallopeptidase n=1 Tax=Sphaerisporangium sp. B11E5 TaxID=3153563 RepID=UPI00325CF66E